MLYIDDTSTKVEYALEQHKKYVLCRVRKKITGNDCDDDNCPVCKHTRQIQNLPSKLLVFFTPKIIEDIIIGKPDVISKINQDLFALYHIKNYTNFSKLYFSIQKKERESKYPNIHHTINTVFDFLERIFSYSWLSDLKTNEFYSLYHLANNLNRNTCTYCNRIYTNTMVAKDNKKVMRPQFDHWFPQSKYPLLALSFYNLIPSCSICNSTVKNDTDFNLKDNIHPYINNIINDFNFDYEYKYVLNSYDTKVDLNISDTDPNAKKIINTLDAMHITDMYDAHQSELKDLILTKKAYSKEYLKSIKSLFSSINLTDDEIYRLIFGVEYDDKNFHKRPFSKFKSDILKKLEII